MTVMKSFSVMVLVMQLHSCSRTQHIIKLILDIFVRSMYNSNLKGNIRDYKVHNKQILSFCRQKTDLWVSLVL